MDSADTDLDILRRVGRGDHDALGTLASRYEAGLLGLALGLLNGRRDLAADAVQDCWLRVLRSADRFEARSGVKAWLYRILINRCHDLRERAAFNPPASFSNNGQRTPAPDDSLADRERLDALRRAVDDLTPEHRLLVLLCYHAGMTHEHAAEALGIPVGTLKSRLHTALTSLRQRLDAPAKGGTS
ncbi:MAG: RNA polymerase sigma factor [Phycisphaerales bacterium]